jgi:hypothetical protein
MEETEGSVSSEDFTASIWLKKVDIILLLLLYIFTILYTVILLM